MDTLLGSENEEVASRGPVKRKFPLLILCVFLILLGLFFVIYGSIYYESEDEKTKVLDRVGVVIDAGGSGTRIIIYSYANKMIKQLNYTECEEQGLAKYSEAELPIMKKKLTDCLVNGAKNLPKHKQVPIYFGATGGMRLLKLRNKEIYDKIWALIKECLRESEFKLSRAGAITGFEEAKWAWVAANYLKHTIKGDGAKFGTIDFGSTSIQLAFDQKSDVKKSDNVKTINIDGHNTTLYGHSYLCYGIMEMERRFLAKIVKTANYTTIVKNPCFFNGYSRNLTSAYLWEKPCSSGDYAKDYLGEDISGPSGQTYTIQGSSNFSQCQQIFTDLISNKCTKGSCGINDVFQPKVNGKFLAFSTFYYIARILGLTANSGKDGYYDAAQKLCALTWKDMNVKYKQYKYLAIRCFQSVYGYYLLADGFKFDKDTWKIEYIKKIDGSKVGWSLGLIYSHKDVLYTRFQDITIVQNPGLIALLVFGPICMIIALLIVLKSCKGDKEQKIKEPEV